jgi:hypothetical protein
VCRYLAHHLGIACVIANQVTARYDSPRTPHTELAGTTVANGGDDEEIEVVDDSMGNDDATDSAATSASSFSSAMSTATSYNPALGVSWAHAVNIRYILDDFQQYKRCRVGMQSLIHLQVVVQLPIFVRQWHFYPMLMQPCVAKSASGKSPLCGNVYSYFRVTAAGLCVLAPSECDQIDQAQRQAVTQTMSAASSSSPASAAATHQPQIMSGNTMDMRIVKVASSS